MSFLFKPKVKSPLELVKAVSDTLQRTAAEESLPKEKEKANEDISKNLVAMKAILYGGDGNSPLTNNASAEPNAELVAQLAQEVYAHDLLQLLIQHIHRLEFEAKKDVALIFNNLLRRQLGARSPTVEYLCTREQVLFDLLKGYENQDIALNCGMILRECIKHEALAKILIESPHFYDIFDYVERSTFDIASDAFATFRDALTKHTQPVADFLQENYDPFFTKYTGLLNSTNYVTKRQSLKLLGELLLDRANFHIMTRYISDAENLKLMMNLLRDKSRNIQFEAFHVFKIFVANPNKTKLVLDILQKNQEKLITFLSNFHNDRTDDEQFNEEKAFLLKNIENLQT